MLVASYLMQDERWINGQLLAEMDHDHRANLIPFLRRSAVALAEWHNQHLDEQAAQEWLLTTPLMAKVTQLEAGRSIESRRTTHERNLAHEAETGYVKQRVLAPSEAFARMAADLDDFGEW